ncbi:DUF1015 domain-containing protein [Mongoliitalea daihaiensis]|uniref:DUF1015 domain-containing protein n=1 Tax=Mongoliitalea daihaiensis TaxID=2782006 RepID=UPI001F34F711|nr:DUF1015 domain-containing protein [Mongoliitalea daihaiensis]UJP64754.1 DUF1015 domain-containing protein [Mongoliitalea daihaiensis]
MAEILPIKGWRYHEKHRDQLGQLVSPLFDVVSEKQLKALYQHTFNSIHVTVPLGEHPARLAADTLRQWKEDAVIVQDQIPGIYVYYQYFKFPGQEEESCRKGFIAQIKAYDWDEGIVLRHENTIAKSVDDRIELLRQTEFQSSATHGLYEDPLHLLEPLMDEAIQNPIVDMEDYQGVREVLAVIHDVPTIRRFLQVLSDKSIILADGHHRYEGAIQYRKSQIISHAEHQGTEAYNYHMMYFTNASSKDLKILPTHRLIHVPAMDEGAILDQTSQYFDVRELDDEEEIYELILQKKWAFGLVFREKAFKIKLKESVYEAWETDFPETIKALDLVVLHYFFLDQVLGMPYEEQRYSGNIRYERNLHKCFATVAQEQDTLALITKDVPMKQVLEVCKSGYTMPQKSTYFYPKTLSGLLFASVKQEEFEFPYEAYGR